MEINFEIGLKFKHTTINLTGNTKIINIVPFGFYKDSDNYVFQIGLIWFGMSIYNDKRTISKPHFYSYNRKKEKFKAIGFEQLSDFLSKP